MNNLPSSRRLAALTSRLADDLESNEAIDGVAGPAREVVNRLLPPGRMKDALHGVWLGHPLHPMLTDLPIGFWTSATVLDLLGGRRGQPAADALVGLGVVSAIPAGAAGAADWSGLDRPTRRSGTVHAVANVAATGLYALSFIARRRGKRGRGIVLGLIGAVAASAGGYLGGHLTFRRAAGVSRTAEVPTSGEWKRLVTDEEPSEGRVVSGHLDGETLAVTMVGGSPTALHHRCSHLGGPLDEGQVHDGCLRCPWHGSTFDANTGAVVRGPATAPAPAYDVSSDAAGYRARSRSEEVPEA